MKKLAVIIPVYKNDNLHFFEKAVKSILDQSYKDYHLIIAVDGPVNSDLANFLESLKDG